MVLRSGAHPEHFYLGMQKGFSLSSQQMNALKALYVLYLRQTPWDGNKSGLLEMQISLAPSPGVFSACHVIGTMADTRERMMGKIHPDLAFIRLTTNWWSQTAQISTQISIKVCDLVYRSKICQEHV